MKQIKLLLFLIFLAANSSAIDGYKRNKSADILAYKFSVSLNDSTSFISASAQIIVRFKEDSDSMELDLASLRRDGNGMTVSSVEVETSEIKWVHLNDRITLFLGRKVPADDTIHIKVDYSGIPADGLIISTNKFGNRTFFSDHWPDRAHNYLPCIDHPYEKALIDFIITAPDKYKVVGTGILLEESNLAGPMSVTHWSGQVPLPVKVMSFGAAAFAVQYTGEVDGVPVSTWVFPENREAGFSDYSVAIRPLKYYSTLLGPYPFEKLANVQSKTIFGGLENAGNIFYSERSVTGQGKAEGLIAHEIAHQWFGNSVTETDWHHIWLSEGFATYLTSLYFESTQGKERLKNDMIKAKETVLKYYEKKQRPVIDTTVTNMMDLLNPNSYQKGSWVLHMLRTKVGDDNFMKGLKKFYSWYQVSNASTSDFISVMEEVSGLDLGRFFGQWLWKPGQPELSIVFRPAKKKGLVTVVIEQKQKDLFEFDLELLVKDNSGERIKKIFVKDRKLEILIAADSKAQIIPDPDIRLLYK